MRKTGPLRPENGPGNGACSWMVSAGGDEKERQRLPGEKRKRDRRGDDPFPFPSVESGGNGGKGNRGVWGYGGKGGLGRAVSVARTLLDRDFQRSFGSVSDSVINRKPGYQSVRPPVMVVAPSTPLGITSAAPLPSSTPNFEAGHLILASAARRRDN